MISSKQHIESLKCIIDKNNHNDFTCLLEQSLKQAKNQAQKSLSPLLYQALDWPKNLEEYIDYLTVFSHWVPQQSGDPAWLKPETDEHQEIYDRLCHFYWLVDQTVGSNKDTVVESIPWFSQWLVTYAKIWGSFLNSTESFSQEILDSFIQFSPQYSVQDSMVEGQANCASGWLTFNQFFARKLNPGLRPISTPFNNSIITSPADCTYKENFEINENSSISEVYIKKTHSFANITELLKGSRYQDVFANGYFCHYSLGPYSYHRFHSPVAGKICECYTVQGLVYLEVKLREQQFYSPNSAKSGYEFSQSRAVLIVDTRESFSGNIGIVAIVPVGMCHVSSVNITATAGKELAKGDELGYFLFGGSDIIVLFQQGTKLQIDSSDEYRHYGSVIAKAVKNKHLK